MDKEIECFICRKHLCFCIDNSRKYICDECHYKDSSSSETAVKSYKSELSCHSDQSSGSGNSNAAGSSTYCKSDDVKVAYISQNSENIPERLYKIKMTRPISNRTNVNYERTSALDEISSPHCSVDPSYETSSDIQELSHSFIRRAIFNPGASELHTTVSVLSTFMDNDEPGEQTELVRGLQGSNNVDRSDIELPIIISDKDRHWFSFQCFMRNCNKTIYSTAIFDHFMHDHPLLTAEHLTRGMYKDFFYDLILTTNEQSCTLFFLVQGVVVGLVDGKYKDCLPVFLMTAKLDLRAICAKDNGEYNSDDLLSPNWKNSEILLMWLTGPVPKDSDIPVSLTVWACDEAGATRSYSGFLVPLHEPQDSKQIYHNFDCLSISAVELEALTNGGKRMIQSQVIVG